MIEARIRPRGAYSLRLTTLAASDATRRLADGVLTAALPEGRAAAWQAPDGCVHVRASSEPALERMRFCLAVDDDDREFVRRFAADPLLGESVRRLRGLRQLRTATVAQALLRAVAGQLVLASEARAIERRVVRAAARREGTLSVPPTRAELGAFAPAQLQRLGLGARKSATLVRLCRSLDLERLRGVPTDAVAARLERERGLGPWSVGVVALEGLGRHERGLARDLGLVKLLAELRGRRVEAEETDELLEPYGEWAGLASVYLLKGYARGLVPVPRRSRAA